MIGKITGTGSCVPERIVENQEIAKWVETSDAWIRERTGVLRRHIADGETTVSMAAIAAKRALNNAGVDAKEIDLLIVATLSSNIIVPSTACEVQKEIHAERAVCFDLNAACTGFLFAYNTVQAYISAGMCEKALVIGAETLSDMTDWTDRSTCILFGDGAGAVVVEAGEGDFYPMIMHSNGKKGHALFCRSSLGKQREYIQMDGQEVFKFAVRKVPEVISEVLRSAQLTVNDIDFFVLHQANQRIVQAVAKRLKTEISRIPMNLMEYGNTSSASIPLLLDELHRGGRLKRGQIIVLAGFGGGLSWGASVLKW
ncbi:MAG: ketoacyl-ACP synthase III [Hespellia sp.]|nr:ketoacyl-ACP synthase III [Hespellia sp.]